MSGTDMGWSDTPLLYAMSGTDVAVLLLTCDCLLRVCHAMSGTNRPYTSAADDILDAVPLGIQVASLPVCYGLSGTDIAYVWYLRAPFCHRVVTMVSGTGELYVRR